MYSMYKDAEIRSYTLVDQLMLICGYTKRYDIRDK